MDFLCFTSSHIFNFQEFFLRYIFFNDYNILLNVLKKTSTFFFFLILFWFLDISVPLYHDLFLLVASIPHGSFLVVYSFFRVRHCRANNGSEEADGACGLAGVAEMIVQGSVRGRCLSAGYLVYWAIVAWLFSGYIFCCMGLMTFYFSVYYLVLQDSFQRKAVELPENLPAPATGFKFISLFSSLFLTPHLQKLLGIQ